MFKTGAQMMILVILAGLVLMRESRQEPLAAWDDRWADFLSTTSRQAQPEAPVTLVGIEEGSLQEHPWPWTPLDFSLFFQATIPREPAVLAIDEVLDWDRFALPEAQLRKLPQYERILLDQLHRAPRMLLGAELGFPEDPQVAPAWQEVPLLRNVKGDVSTLAEFPIVDHQPTEEYRLAATIGFTNLPPVHERYNSVPLLFRHHGQVVPSFPLQAVMMWARLTPDEVTVQLGSFIELGRSRRIPIDSRGRLRVDFGTPRGELNFDDLLFATEQAASGAKPTVNLAKLKGRVILLSRTDAKAKKLPLAASRQGSPGELFAAAIATMQNGSFIQRAPVWAEGLVLGLLAVLSLFVPRWSRFMTFGVAVVTLAAYVLVSMAVFNRWLLWLPGVMPAGAALCFVVFRMVGSSAVPKPKKPVIL
jgi:CHASE2 domain-containing sensor protein